MTAGVADDNASRNVLWYAQPARNWERDALPIGNGSLGGMVFGGTDHEHIQSNEDSLWIGDEQDTGAYQASGDLYVKLDHKDSTNYRRKLDIGKAVHAITYTSKGVAYTREYVASYPAQVMVCRLLAGLPIIVTHAGGKVETKDDGTGVITFATKAGSSYAVSPKTGD